MYICNRIDIYLKLNDMDYIDKIIAEEVDSFLKRELVCEMGMTYNRMYDKFGEVVNPIVDNLVCICLYPNCQAVTHWRERSYSHCKRFVDTDIEPLSNNNYDFRLNCLNEAIVETLNRDFSAIKNHFKSVSKYYANRPNRHDRLTPYKPYEECYVENADRVKNGILTIAQFVAKQDYEGLIEYMNTF